jgi:hypothetical protein
MDLTLTRAGAHGLAAPEAAELREPARAGVRGASALRVNVLLEGLLQHVLVLQAPAAVTCRCVCA